MTTPYYHHRHRSVFSEFFNDLYPDLVKLSDKNLQIVIESFAMESFAYSKRSLIQKFTFEDRSAQGFVDINELDKLCTNIDEFIHGCVLPLSKESIGSISHIKAYLREAQSLQILAFEKKIEVKSYHEGIIQGPVIVRGPSPSRIRKREETEY